jgi:hypothetical protein
VVGPFKSIDKPQTVSIDPRVTVLVGMNEAGKTVFLQCLNKCRDVLGVAAFSPLDDYPRKELPAYLRVHDTHPATVARLEYALSDEEIQEINHRFHTTIPRGFTFALEYQYDNTWTAGFSVDERPVLKALIADASLSDDARAAAIKGVSLRDARERLRATQLTYADNEFVAALDARVERAPWASVVGYEIWLWLEPRVPTFLYFGDYEVLPSKMNLKDLAARQEQAPSNPSALTSEHRGVLALLRMADIDVADFARPNGYEQLRAKIEGVSAALTDQIMEFWKQNEDLEVQIDIAPDPYDEAPFNDGPNLYLRIKNRRRRGISTPFKQRSRGFIWFFSFLVWFDSVQQQLAQAAQQDMILLLDEPGLSLHALAQRDLLGYIDALSQKHQVIYTTHSPFLVHTERLWQVRTVEDQLKRGTVITDDIASSDPRTVFPLQAALGWNVTENLFASPRTLLVENPSDLLYLTMMSATLEATGEGLRPDITIVPMGGLDRVAAFGALPGAMQAQLAILQSDRNLDARTVDAIVQKLMAKRALLMASQFRHGGGPRPTDLEDLFDPWFYLEQFSRAFADLLHGGTVTESELPSGDRIAERIERWLASQRISTRQDGGFNRYQVATYMATHPPVELPADTSRRFAALFAAVNAQF